MRDIAQSRSPGFHEASVNIEFVHEKEKPFEKRNFYLQSPPVDVSAVILLPREFC